MPELTIRAAVADDADAIGDFQTRCWDQTYRGLVPDAYLDAVTAVDRADRWHDRIVTGERRVLLALAGDDLLGVASTAPTPAGRADLPALELASIYVERSSHGSGVGQRLLDAALGDRPAHLWVFTANARASAFYAKNGFRPSDEVQVDPDTGVEETRWVRDGRTVRP